MYFSFVYLKSCHVCSLKFTKKKRQLWIFIHLRPFFFFEITKVWLCSFTCCKIKVFIKMFFFNKYGKNKKYWRYKWWWFFSLFFLPVFDDVDVFLFRWVEVFGFFLVYTNNGFGNNSSKTTLPNFYQPSEILPSEWCLNFDL